jgi:hypothetical protein
VETPIDSKEEEEEEEQGLETDDDMADFVPLASTR